jgi:hypothetical protein
MSVVEGQLPEQGGGGIHGVVQLHQRVVNCDVDQLQGLSSRTI